MSEEKLNCGGLLSPSHSHWNYVLISPVKDEEKHIETTIQAVLQQTVRPLRWIIVDDGSRDDTRSIVEGYSKQVPWMTLLCLDRGGQRQAGSPVVRAFQRGLEVIRKLDYDFVVKFDCDLDCEPDYFERLLAKFQQDESLGIASGVYLEKNERQCWVPVKMPTYHAAGACKVIRAKCFQDIGGFLPVNGWDTIDEIRAQIAGWKTLHFRDLQFYHLRKEGSAVGFLRTNLRSGEGYYLTGGGQFFFLLKVLYRAVWGKPFLLGAAVMSFGYLKAWAGRKPRLVNDAEARFYRRLLNQRLLGSLARRVSSAKTHEKGWDSV